MCQLNSYFVPKAVSSEKVLLLMAGANLNCTGLMDDYKEIAEFKDYNAYFAAGQRCNCGSVISRLQDTDYKTFEDFKVNHIQQVVKELEDVRNLMLSPNYAQEKEKFLKEQETLFEKMHAQSEWIREKEIALTDEVMLRTDISDEEKSNLMHETVYPLISKLISENEQTPETAEVREELIKFSSKYSLMQKSVLYTLEESAPEIYEAVPLTLKKSIELAGYPSTSEEDQDGNQEITFTIPSNNIFAVIEETKKNDFVHLTDEFARIRMFINAVFEFVDHIILFAYWQSDDCIFIGKHTINFRDLTIDLLLFLPYLTLLEIRK